MNIQTLIHKLQTEGLRLTAQRSRGEYRCEVSRDGQHVSASNDPTLHGAVLSALYAAPMAHIVTQQPDIEIVLS